MINQANPTKLNKILIPGKAKFAHSWKGQFAHSWKGQICSFLERPNLFGPNQHDTATKRRFALSDCRDGPLRYGELVEAH
jgi:hypothetical protein